MSITSKWDTEPHGNKTVPVDPYIFGQSIQYSQVSTHKHDYDHTVHVLFNKGRYFETTFGYPDKIQALCDLTGFKPQHTNMIAESWDKLEDFVIACNILNIYVDIKIDWI